MCSNNNIPVAALWQCAPRRSCPTISSSSGTLRSSRRSTVSHFYCATRVDAGLGAVKRIAAKGSIVPLPLREHFHTRMENSLPQRPFSVRKSVSYARGNQAQRSHSSHTSRYLLMYAPATFSVLYNSTSRIFRGTRPEGSCCVFGAHHRLQFSPSNVIRSCSAADGCRLRVLSPVVNIHK